MQQLISFASRGRIGLVHPDGCDLRWLSFDISNQVNWQLGPAFADGDRFIVTSYEEGKSWEHQVNTHMWVYSFRQQTLDEIATHNKLAPLVVCAGLLPGEQRMIAQPVIDHEQRAFTMNLDGAEQVELTARGEGFVYGVSLSPDGTRIAYHITGPDELPYRIRVMDVNGANKVTVAQHADHLYFAPTWSPDGRWLLYVDCLFKTDPGHDWADLCLGKPEGSAHHVITAGQRQWFGTSYGTPQTRGGGSDVPQWSPQGYNLAWTRGVAGSRTAWPFQPQRPDTDHFNRDYVPEEARGGTQVVLMNPFTGKQTELTPFEENVWSFRPRWSADGTQLAFTRARIGEASEIWVMNADGSNAHLVARGYDDLGADHARWVTLS